MSDRYSVNISFIPVGDKPGAFSVSVAYNIWDNGVVRPGDTVFQNVIEVRPEPKSADEVLPASIDLLTVLEPILLRRYAERISPDIIKTSAHAVEEQLSLGYPH
jgi:hypothetical protein